MLTCRKNVLQIYLLLLVPLLTACQPSSDGKVPTEEALRTTEIAATASEQPTVLVEATPTSTQPIERVPPPTVTPQPERPVYPLDSVSCSDSPTLIRAFDSSQDGTTLAVTGHDGLSVVRLSGDWSAAGKREEGQFILASLSPDGQRLAAVNSLDDTVFVWDVQSLQTVHQLTHRSADDLTTLAWSSMGSFIAAGGRNGKVVVWDAQSGETIMVFTLYEYSGGISSIAWSPLDENLFIVGSLDGGYAMVELDQQSFEGAAFRGAVRDIQWSPRGTYFSISAKTQGHTSVYYFLGNSWDRAFYLDFPTGMPTGSTWSPSGQQVALYGDEKLAVYDIAERLVHEIQVPNSSFEQALWATDERHLYTRFIAASSIVVWDVQAEERVFESDRFFDQITDMRQGGDLLFLSIGLDYAPERAIAVWDTQSMQPIGYIVGADHPECSSQ